MAKYCNEGCSALCDFCIHFKAVEYDELEDWHSDGICKITGNEVGRADYCEEDFECFRI